VSILDNLYVGCAGWAIRPEFAAEFPLDGSHLSRYAQRFRAVEINSSFRLNHQRKTYERWAGAVPAGFRFSVKLPKSITQVKRFVASEEELEAFLNAVTGLGPKLGPILIQLPPSFAFDIALAQMFFSFLRKRHIGPLVIEPRHPGWSSAIAQATLDSFDIVRVKADPVLIPEPPAPVGRVVYRRLHGSPRTYYSPYEQSELAKIADELRLSARTAETWCIFDNTALGHAFANSLDLIRRCAAPDVPPSDSDVHSAARDAQTISLSLRA